MAGENTLAASPGNEYLYNGKELQDELGLGWYDYGARMYAPDERRWKGVDALGEKAPSWTPYRYGFNNPVKFVDPSGNYESTHTDMTGKVIAVYADGDLGVYRHADATTQAEVDVKRETMGNSGGGEKMGETAHLFSFAAANPLERGIVTPGEDAYIDFSSTWAGDKVNTYLAELDGATSFFTYAANAGKDERYDIKTNEDNPGNEYYGSRLPDGTIVSHGMPGIFWRGWWRTGRSG